MGGLFGGVGRALGGLFGGDSDFSDGIARTQAILNGDYAAAAQIGANSQLKHLTIQEKRKAIRDQAELDAMIDSDPRLNTPQLKAYAKADPKSYIANVMQMYQPRQFAAGGGSLGLPDASGHLTFQTAPRFDDNGTIYAPGNGTSAPPILQQGTKAVPVQPGGQVQIVDSITGQPVMGGPPSGAPAVGSPSPEAVAYLRQHPELAPHFDAKYGAGSASSILGQGGASPSNGSSTFP